MRRLDRYWQLSRRWLPALDPYLVLLLALSAFALLPLLADGYFYGAHDGRHSVFYVTMFDEAIRDRALWPRWAMHHNQGYGYPTFLVQAPLAFYVAEIFVLLGAGITNAVKITWAIAVLASAWGMYALVRNWGSGIGDRGSGIGDRHNVQLAGLIAGLLYVYVPYHLLDVYVRAALAETMLMAWFPWVFLAFDRLIVGGTAPGWRGRLLAAALSLAALLLTHVLALLAFPPLLIGFILFRLALQIFNTETQRRRDAEAQTAEGTDSSARTTDYSLRIMHYALRIALPAVTGIAALLLAAIFILPLLAEGPLLEQEAYVRETYSYDRHWVYFGQFFNPFWGYGYSDDPNGANDGMGFQVGLLPLLFAFAGLYLLVAVWKRMGAIKWLIGFLVVATATILFSATPAAAGLWSAVPTLAMLQFPWRLLTLSSFTISALGGVVAWQLLTMAESTEREMGAGIAIGLVIVFASLGYARPQDVQPVEPWREDGRAIWQFEQEHPDMFGYTDWVEERFTETPMTPQYAAEDFSNDRLERLAIRAGEGDVLSHYSRGHSFGGVVDLTTAGTVQVRVYHFPGWRVFVDGAAVAHRISPPHGLIEVDVPPGRHRIDVRMGSTPVRTAGVALSAGTLVLLLVLWGQGTLSERRDTAPKSAQADSRLTMRGEEL